MTTTKFFTNRKNLQPQGKAILAQGDVLIAVTSGRYGSFAKVGNYTNKSEKAMLADGFVIENLTKQEVADLRQQISTRDQFNQNYWLNEKLEERKSQVEICIKSEPLEIESNPYFEAGQNPISKVVDLCSTPMIEAYHGCGKGTAYVNSGKLVAFHYGHQQPTNVPINCEVVRVELSGTQVCFF